MGGLGAEASSGVSKRSSVLKTPSYPFLTPVCGLKPPVFSVFNPISSLFCTADRADNAFFNSLHPL